MQQISHEPFVVSTTANQLNQSPQQTNVDTNNYTIIDSEHLRKKIILSEIYPAYVSEMHGAIKWRKYWGRIASVSFVLTFIVMSASTFVSFSSSKFPNLDYLAGALGLVALINDRFAHFADKKSSECTTTINVLLKSIGVNDAMPDTSTQAVGNSEMSQSNNQGNLSSPHTSAISPA